MEKMDEESVDLVVTSPPYDDLRTYNNSSKWDLNTFYAVAAQLNRVLKPGGVIMWNVNDATMTVLSVMVKPVKTAQNALKMLFLSMESA